MPSKEKNNSQNKTVHIYALVDPNTREVRYVGKANDLGARMHLHLKSNTHHNAAKNRWIASLLAEGLKPVVTVIEMVSFSKWQERERFWIAEFRRRGAVLTNTLPGGNGSGTVAERTRAALSVANKGKVRSAEQRARMSAARRASPLAMSILRATGLRPKSAATRRKMSEASKGVPKSEAHRKALGLSRKGKPLSQSHREAMSRGLKGVLKGIPKSQSHKGALSAAKTEWRKRYVTALLSGKPTGEARASSKKGK
jgi:hypothetical protein